MIQLSINLPAKRRLDLNLVKRRKDLDQTPLFPDLGEIRRIKKGHKISRFFRHLFEQKRIKKLLGANLAAIAIASSFYPTQEAFVGDYEENTTATAPIILTTKSGVRYPLNSVRLTQGYKLYHPGVDFDGITGEPVYPVMNGRVEAVQYSRYAYGNAVMVDHGSNISTLYAHLSAIFVQKDQHVTSSNVLGTVGATGRASGDHLHFEVRQNNYPINPYSLLPK